MGDVTILLIQGQGIGVVSLEPALRKEGFAVNVFHTGAAALRSLDDHLPSIVVFDSSSMRSNGLRNCRRLRRRLPEVPIVHIRPSGAEEDRSAGADVYLAQPFTPRKLINRIHALLPAEQTAGDTLRAGAMRLHLSKRSVEIAGKGEHRLTPKLAHLLEQFILHPNETLSRRWLMETIWETAYLGDTRTLDVHIRWIRELIEDNPARPIWLITVRGEGYRFLVPAENDDNGLAESTATSPEHKSVNPANPRS
ncbi:MAG: response regulator transcription factor [Chloroflexota bacterium]